jgi:hypothetical protein
MIDRENAAHIGQAFVPRQRHLEFGVAGAQEDVGTGLQACRTGTPAGDLPRRVESALAQACRTKRHRPQAAWQGLIGAAVSGNQNVCEAADEVE